MVRVDNEVREQIRRMAYPHETASQTLRRIIIGGDMTGPGTASYSLLEVLLHYAPDADARDRMQVDYNTLAAECGANLDQLNLVLAGAIVQGLIDGDWPWVIQRRNEQAVLQPRPDCGPKGDPALQRTPVRRQVSRHIISAFADLPIGTKLTIAQIVAHTSEEYGNNHPSPGAVMAWLFRTDDGKRESLTPGIVPCYVNNVKGGERVA
jgi:hypothetical protein